MHLNRGELRGLEDRYRAALVNSLSGFKSANLVEAAHQTAARYAREVCEFDATGLSREWQDGFAAPFVGESSIQLAMELREEQTLAINGTHLVIGEIVSVTVPEHSVQEDGSLDIAAAGSVALSGLDAYHQTQCLRRMAYAKPDLPPRRLHEI